MMKRLESRNVIRRNKMTRQKRSERKKVFPRDFLLFLARKRRAGMAVDWRETPNPAIRGVFLARPTDRSTN